jgi:hypothetical protein
MDGLIVSPFYFLSLFRLYRFVGVGRRRRRWQPNKHFAFFTYFLEREKGFCHQT